MKHQETSGEILFNRSAGRLESSGIDQKMEIVINTAINKIDTSASNEIDPVINEIDQVINQKISLRYLEPENTTEK